MKTEATDKPRFASTEEKLKAMRTGYKFAHELKYGDYIIPVRVLTADEENRVHSEARLAVAKVPSMTEEQKEVLVPLETMKLILNKASTINVDQHLPRSLLDLLTSSELQAIYEGYLDIIAEVDKEFESLTHLEITEIISTVKKKSSSHEWLIYKAAKGDWTILFGQTPTNGQLTWWLLMNIVDDLFGSDQTV